MGTLGHLKQPILAMLAAVTFSFLVDSASAQQPAGVAPCEVPVFIFQTGLGGMSTLYNWQPVIFLDPVVAYGDPDIREFVTQHECGHHANGDTLPHGTNAPVANVQRELAADCYAAEHVPQNISEAAAKQFEQTQGGASPLPGYPTGNERAANIRKCAHIQGPHPVPGCSGLPSGLSLTCHFMTGFKAGHTQSFCGFIGAIPPPIGGSCTDGMGSFGVAE